MTEKGENCDVVSDTTLGDCLWRSAIIAVWAVGGEVSIVVLELLQQ